MFRKLTVVICLLSFLPSSLFAQGLSTTTTAPVAVVAETTVPSGGNVNLLLAAEKSATILVATADTSHGAATKLAAPEQKKESHGSFDLNNFADVHLAEGRWMWWAGALVILAAIHVSAK